MTNAETDYLLARCSVAAYDGKPLLVSHHADVIGLTDLRYFTVGSVQAFIANVGDESRRRSIVAFAGTDPKSLADLLRDAEISLTDCDYGPGRVHEGFDFCAAMVWKAMYDDLVRREPIAVLCTGHSKGAAEATLFAARLSHFDSMATQLVTFGSPRVGDKKFARWLRGQLVDCRRYVRTCDLVTRLPLCGFRMHWKFPPMLEWQTSYRHVGPASYIDANGRLLVDPPRLYIVADRLRARWRHIGVKGTAGIEAHFARGYLDDLKRFAA